MYRELPKLMMYRELGKDSIIVHLSEIIRDFDGGDYDKDELISRIYAEIHRLLEIATDYGFDKNLWHDYIAYVLVTNENPFSLTAERAATVEGSVNGFAKEDMRIFMHLFNYDFQKLERTLGIDCFSTVTDYKSVHKRHQMYNRSVSRKVRDVSDSIAAISLVYEEEQKFPENFKTKSADDTAAEMLLDLVKEFYKAYGVGMLGLNAAFRIAEVVPSAGFSAGAGVDSNVDSNRMGTISYSNNILETPSYAVRKSIDFQIGRGISCTPIKNTNKLMLDDLIGYDIQKTRLRENTESFLAGKPANNVLLFGDAGTGKSTSIKALINEYYDDGLRMIELYKHQMKLLAPLISSIKNRNYRFIIYMDDLSFEENETEYKYLKAVIEGGLETRPDNVLIYATSNRRNLIRETWNDTNDVELDKHRSDTLQEKLSLVSRFGVTIPYMRPDKKDYEEIVKQLAERVRAKQSAAEKGSNGLLTDLGLDGSAENKLNITDEELLALANKWSVSHGGMSGRAAQQLIDSLS